MEEQARRAAITPSVWRQTLGDVLRRSAARHPQKLAIACADVTWSYRELDQICDRLAAGLAARGVIAGERVAILARNSHGFVALRLALARMGAVLVPINFMLKAADVAYILRHAQAQRLFVDSSLLELGREAASLDTAVTELLWLPSEAPASCPAGMCGFDQLLQDGDGQAVPDPDIDGRSLLQIVYTSGTESLPKGAMLTHEAILSEYVSCVVDVSIEADDLMLHALPLYHCAQLDVFLGPALYVGASNIITAQPTPDNLLELLQRHAVTSFFAPPTVWIALLRSPRFDQTDLSRLHKAYYGASIMPVEVLKELLARLPKVLIRNLYGQTEIGPIATVLQPEDQLRKAGTAGRPVLNVETRVVDDEGADVAVGEIGEVVHRSPQLMLGYFKDPARTESAFAGGWFHSGDLAIIDDEGFITIVDRKKDMIKTGGENVASREVEEALYRLPQVSEVAVIGLPHPRWIEAVTAVIVVKDGQHLDVEMVNQHCREHLSTFKQPKQVLLVDSLPKNPSGKLLKRELRERYQHLSGS